MTPRSDAEHGPRGAPRGDVQEGEEDGVEQEGRAQVPLDDDHAHPERDHREHRCEVLERREADRAEPGPLGREERPVLREVSREEDDEDHLQELGRLAAERADDERQARAALVHPEDERESEEPEPGEGPRVLVHAEPRVGPDHDREHAHDREAEAEPEGLQLREAEVDGPDVLRHVVLREPDHEEEPQPAQHAHRREEDLVGAAAGEDLREVDERERDPVDDQEAPALHGRGAGPRHPQGEATRREDDVDEDEEERLAPARPGSEAGDAARRHRRGGRHRRPRSRRIRTRPTWTSSPTASGTTPSTRLPLMYVPFVLPRSSMNHARPR